jgi:hypothetical protein
MNRKEMLPYRESQETELDVTHTMVAIHRDRLADLERDSAVLQELEGHWLSVEHTGHRRWAWEVELYTGEWSDVYPCTVDGQGKTLRAAVEDAFDWEPVKPWTPPPDLRATFFWRGVLAATLLLCGIYLTMQFGPFL